MQTYIEIFIIGLLGSMHCIGMCGGVVAMYTLKKSPSMPSVPYHLLYNLGRITTYSLLGGLMGIIGSYGAYIGNPRGLPGAVLLLAGAIMALTGPTIAVPRCVPDLHNCSGHRQLFPRYDNAGRFRAEPRPRHALLWIYYIENPAR